MQRLSQSWGQSLAAAVLVGLISPLASSQEEAADPAAVGAEADLDRSPSNDRRSDDDPTRDERPRPAATDPAFNEASPRAESREQRLRRSAEAQLTRQREELRHLQRELRRLATSDHADDQRRRMQELEQMLMRKQTAMQAMMDNRLRGDAGPRNYRMHLRAAIESLQRAGLHEQARRVAEAAESVLHEGDHGRNHDQDRDHDHGRDAAHILVLKGGLHLQALDGRFG